MVHVRILATKKSRRRYSQVRSRLVLDRLVPAATEHDLGTNQRATAKVVPMYHGCKVPHHHIDAQPQSRLHDFSIASNNTSFQLP